MHPTHSHENLFLPLTEINYFHGSLLVFAARHFLKHLQLHFYNQLVHNYPSQQPHLFYWSCDWRCKQLVNLLHHFLSLEWKVLHFQKFLSKNSSKNSCPSRILYFYLDYSWKLLCPYSLNFYSTLTYCSSYLFCEYQWIPQC